MSDKLLACSHGFACPLPRYLGTGASFTIGNSLEIVSAGEESAQGDRQIRVVLGQPQELRLHAPVGFKHSADALEYKRLGSVKAREVGRASRSIIEANAEHSVCLGEQVLRFRQKGGCLRGHRSR